jgi:hypothetical protein
VGKGRRCVGLTSLPPYVLITLKSGSLSLVEPSRPIQACSRIALTFTTKYKSCKQMISQTASISGFREWQDCKWRIPRRSTHTLPMPSLLSKYHSMSRYPINVTSFRRIKVQYFLHIISRHTLTFFLEMECVEPGLHSDIVHRISPLCQE